MTSILDAAILVQKETTYGTAAAPITKAYEGHADTLKREVAFLDSIGLRAGLKGQRSDRRKNVNMGASGTLELDFLTKSMGHLLQGMVTSTGAPVQQAATPAYQAVFQALKDEPGLSYTFQVLRPIVEGAVQAFTYLGATIDKWKLTQDVGGNLVVAIDFDAQDERIDVAAGTPAYPAAAVPFDWTQGVVTLGGASFEPDKFSFEYDLGLKTDRRYVRGSQLKRQPRRNKLPSAKGSLEGDFSALTSYNAFVAGTVQTLSVVWTGALISGAYNFKVQLDAPAVQFDGDTPHASLQDLSAQTLPFTVLDDGTNPLCTITIVSTDTTL